MDTNELTINPLKMVESESVVVSKIFKLYSEHRSLGKVAESLNHQKIETRRGKPFSRMTIKNMDFPGFAGHNLSRILRQEVSHDPT